jgi:hypothetical protein
MNTNTYVIANVSELNNIDYSQVSQTSAETVRKSIDLTKFILKYDGGKPSTIQSLEDNDKLISYDGKKYFSHPQILNIVKDVEWTGTQSFLS